MSTSWKQHFSSLAVNDQGNQNLNEFSGAFSSKLSSEEKLRNLVEDMDSMFFAADGEKKVQSYHSLKNLGGTRLRKENKVIALLGVGPVAVCVELSLESALKDCNLNRIGCMGAYMRPFFDTLRGTLNSFVNIKNQVVNP